MRLHVIQSGMFKLDGGAMFGVVPKTIWNKINPADEKNLCSWAMRCLLVEMDNRLILIDNGIGNKQDDKFFSHNFLHGEHSLLNSLKKAGFTPDEITDVFQTHLHFDHCGGGIQWKDADRRIPELTFKNAKYWSNEEHWLWATQPNHREKASFLPENINPIKDSGHLEMIKPGSPSPFPGIEILYFDGHTEKQMIPKIKYNDKTLVFVADLLPSAGHIPIPYIMAYDTRPLISMEEKKIFLETAAENSYILFFEHDPFHECCTVQKTDKGVRLKDLFNFSDI